MSFFYKNLVLIFFLCISSVMRSQAFIQQETLIKDALKLSNYEPEESIKIGKHLLQNAQLDTEKIIPHLILSKSYYSKGDLNIAIMHAFDVTKYSKKNISKAMIESLLIKYDIMRTLYIDGQAKKYLQELEAITAFATWDSLSTQINSKLALIDLKTSLDRQNYKEADTLIKKINKKNLHYIQNSTDLNQQYNICKGILFANTGFIDKAFAYLREAKIFSDKREEKNNIEQVLILFELGKLYSFKKEYAKAITYFKESLQLANKLEHVLFMAKINHQLAMSYLEIKDKNAYYFHNNESLIYNEKLEEEEQNAVNTTFNLINQEQNRKSEQKEYEKKSYFYVVLGVTILIVFILIILSLKSIWKQKRLKEIVRYLEVSRNKMASSNEKPVKKLETQKKLIPEETENILLEKLKKFEKSDKFLSKDLSLAVLAGQLETNTKYLSGVINTHYQDNFNTYINKLRVNYIIEKLKTDPNYRHYKISYLADVCGFSSHSVFGAVFKSLTKITPATFIELLNSEIEEHMDLDQIINES